MAAVSADKQASARSSDSNASPGRLMRSAREGAGVSLAELADEMNILVGQLRALEDNDYSKFNAEIFVRGHIRSYASVFDLPVEPLLHDAEHHFHVFKRAPENRKSQRIAAMNARVHLGLALILATVVWAIAVAVYGDSSSSGAQRAPISIQVLPIDELSPSLAARNSEYSNRYPALPLGKFRASRGDISLSFRESSWLQLRDANGKRLLSGIQGPSKAGLEFAGLAPFDLILSRWQAVEVRYNGRRLNLQQLLEGEAATARIRVGELRPPQP